MYGAPAKFSVLTFWWRQHQKLAFQGSIQSLSKEDGEVYLITMICQDGSTELRHSIDRSPSAARETSMKPFLDNGHVDKTHKFRVQFQGSHILKITRRDNQGLHKLERRGQPNPIYKFNNKKGDRWWLLFAGLHISLTANRLLGVPIPSFG